MKPIVIRCLTVTAASVAASLLVTIFLMSVLMDGPNMVGLIIATIVPVTIAFPTMWFFERNRNKLLHAYKELDKAHNQLAILHEELGNRASKDALTGIMNREAFLSAFTNCQGDQCHGAVMMVDADHFKQVNDRFGHLTGDRALKTLAEALRQPLRQDDLLGRLGGEEFAIFLPIEDPGLVRRKAEEVRKGVEETDFRLDDGTPYPLTVSIGVAYTRYHSSIHEALNSADQALYQAKRNGRNRVSITTLDTAAEAI